VIARRVVVTGRVQGVGFRWATFAEALRLGVVGWVRNRTDGTVEACVAGDPEVVESMLAWLRAGPPGSRVHRATVEEVPVDPSITGFEIRD
jgi:acylphosphatase